MVLGNTNLDPGYTSKANMIVNDREEDNEWKSDSKHKRTPDRLSDRVKAKSKD